LSKGITHISMTDCWEHSESSLSFIHRSIRRIVFKYTDKWVVPGTLGAAHLNKNYNVALDEIIQVPLCADIEENVLISKISTQRKIDFIFVGNFEARKNPILFIEACNILQQNIALKVAITMVGDGALLADCKSLAKKYKLNINFTGNVESQQVIDLLSMSKYMAFPTSLDAWGLVVNEALSVGTPVISSIFAASTADLVINEGNGYVINKLDAQEIGGLMLQAYHLSDEDWAVFSESAKIISKDFSYKIAAKKLINEVFL
jgi:glycosyltransferase involved in cell wall biosynthesis